MRGRFEIIVLALLTLLFLVWMWWTNVADGTLTIRAKVVDTSGQPLAGTVVTLTREGRNVQSASNTKGCVFVGVTTSTARQQWSFRAERSGYEPLAIDVVAPARHNMVIRLPQLGSPAEPRVEDASPEEVRCR